MVFDVDHRLFVTRLYRKLLRQQLKWKDKEAMQYGWSQVTEAFRANRGETDKKVVKDLLHSADERYKVMMAYGQGSGYCTQRSDLEIWNVIPTTWDPYEKMMSDHYSLLETVKGSTKGGHEFARYTHMFEKKKRRRKNAEKYQERARTRKLPESEMAAAGVLEHMRVVSTDTDIKKSFTKKHSDKEMDESDYHFPNNEVPFG